MSPLQADSELGPPGDSDQESRRWKLRHVFGDVIHESAAARCVSAVALVMTASTTLRHGYTVPRRVKFVACGRIPTRMALDSMQRNNLRHIRLAGDATFRAL